MKFLDLDQEGEPLLYTAKQLARLLAISEKHLRDITFPRGTLRCVKLTPNGRPFYQRSTVIFWLSGLEEQQNTMPNGTGEAISHAVQVQSV